MIELLKYCLLLFVTTTSLGFSIGLLLNSRKITILQGHWAGFITLIVILQFWSIFLPVNWNILFLILTLSVPGFLLLARTMPARISTQWRSLPLFTLAAVLPLVFLLYSGCKNVTWYDTPLYHLNAVRWINDFAVVPGLANLHERFGFNSSFLLFGAFTNIGPASGSASHIALPYLLCITVCEIIWRATRQGRGLGIILAVLFIPYFLDRGYSSESASLSTDLSTNCIMCVAILYMTDRPTRFNLILVAGLCSLAFVFKLTAFPVLLCWGTYLVLQWLRKRDSNAYVLVLPAIILGGFAIRNVIVSGWAIFPFPLGNLHISWSVPDTVVIETIEWIRGWARSGPASQQGTGQSVSGWLIPWLDQRRSQSGLLAIMVTMVCLIASIVIRRFRWRTSSNLVRVFAIGSMGTIYTFWAAPDFRFGGFFVWVLLISSFLLLLASLRLPKSVSQMVVIAFLILWIWKMDALVPHAQDTGVSLTRLNRESSAELKSVRTPEGFDYFVPIHGDQCGNSPLPCAPRVIQLKLRNPQDIRDGFLPAAIQN